MFSQGSQAKISRQWKKISGGVKFYAYAEQGGSGFSGKFKKWPNSKYQLPGDKPFNNSNTFVRAMVRSGGLPMMELSGSHPGDNTPSKLVNVYSDKPWKNGQPAPPAPKNPP